MTLLAVALAGGAVAWQVAVFHPPDFTPDDPEPPRVIGPPPSLIYSTKIHLGVRWHSDDPLDQAITVQLSEAVIPFW